MFADSAMSQFNSPHSDDAEKEPNVERRQYTLKGVESEAIELMREAAQTQGRKIGHWVSEKLKEAAVQSLEEHHKKEDALQSMASSGGLYKSDIPRHESGEQDALVHELYARVSSLELEMRDLIRQQRDVFAMLLRERS